MSYVDFLGWHRIVILEYILQIHYFNMSNCVMVNLLKQDTYLPREQIGIGGQGPLPKHWTV